MSELRFDPQDPFPLVNPESYSYAAGKKHSAEVDEWLGLRTESTEKKIYNNALYDSTASSHTFMPEYWRGLPIQTLLTPYIEIRMMLAPLDLKPGQTVVDLGAAYGRMGHVIGHHYSSTHFVGYEFVHERVEEAVRCLNENEYPHVRMEQADLSAVDFSPVSADVYFVYDFGSKKAIEKTLQDLRHIAQTRAIIVIGRGRSTRTAIERQHPWLSQVAKPEHFDQFSIYRSRSKV